MVRFQKNALINEYNNVIEELQETQSKIYQFIRQNQAICSSKPFEFLIKTNHELSNAMNKGREIITKIKRRKHLQKAHSLMDEIITLKRIYISYFLQLRNLQEQYEREQRFEKYKKDNKKYIPAFSAPQFGYFEECITKKELMKTYKKLARKYHPDNGGDPKIFITINQEFEKRKELLS